jgi:hypothetical protein
MESHPVRSGLSHTTEKSAWSPSHMQRRTYAPIELPSPRIVAVQSDFRVRLGDWVGFFVYV